MKRRMTNRERRRIRFVKYIRNTWMNKVLATALILCGIVVTSISGDGTALVFLGMFAVPTFFTGKQVVY